MINIMSKPTSNPAREKYLSLLKQTTCIDFNIVSADEVTDSKVTIHEVAGGEKVVLKSTDLTTFQRAQRRNQLVVSR